MDQLTLYGLNKAGGYKVWIITTDDQGLITIQHGKEGGKLQVKSELVKGKNLGRSNETTPAEQAVSEAEGKIKKQKDSGYRETKEELEELPLLAMLAVDFTKVGHRMEFPCYGSDKYDGLRCLAKKRGGMVTLESRKGLPYDLPHIQDQLSRTMFEGETYDGEIYLHGYALQEISSAVKRTDTQGAIDDARRKYDKLLASNHFGAEILAAQEELEDAQRIHLLRPELQFIIFDALSFDITEETPFEDRLAHLGTVSGYMAGWATMTHIRTATYVPINNEEELRAAHADAVRRGYEGLMLRSRKGLYESGKRSSGLMKYKTFLDEEFEVVGYEIDKDGCIVYVCKNNLNDHTFNVIFGSKEWKRMKALTAGEDNGKFLTVKFQTRYKNTLLPQFPTGVDFREGTVVNGEFIPSE